MIKETPPICSMAFLSRAGAAKQAAVSAYGIYTAQIARSAAASGATTSKRMRSGPAGHVCGGGCCCASAQQARFAARQGRPGGAYIQAVRRCGMRSYTYLPCIRRGRTCSATRVSKLLCAAYPKANRFKFKQF